MTNDKTYNGWSNYETWVVKLWIDNDEGDQQYWLERARTIYEWSKPTNYASKEDVAARDLADELKERHEELAPEQQPENSGVFTDLMNAALSNVNWREIAESFIQEQAIA